MKNFRLFLLSFVLIAGFLTSCSNDESVVEEQNIVETEAITISLNRLAQKFDDQGNVIVSANPAGNIVFDFCFDFIYPLNLSYTSRTTVRVNSLDDLITVLINSTDDLYINGVEFPFDVETYNDNTNAIEIVTINNEDEFFDLLDDCNFDSLVECACYQVYDPVCVEIEAPDGENFIITYSNECYAMCDGFDPDDFIENCAGDGNNPGGFECFDFNFPLTIITDNQQTITVNSQQELDNALYNSYYFDFVYPFNVTNDEGDVESMGSEENYVNLLEDCYGYNNCPCPANVDPVCVEIDLPGGGTEIVTFLNACEAECEGFTTSDFIDCDVTNCIEEVVFYYLLQCKWYITTSLYDNINPEYAQFYQDGSLEIYSDGSTQSVAGNWDLSTDSTSGEVFVSFNIIQIPYDSISELDWTVTECGEEYIVLESGSEYLRLERDCD